MVCRIELKAQIIDVQQRDDASVKVGGIRDYFDEQTLAKMDHMTEVRLSPSFGYTGQDPVDSAAQARAVLKLP